MSAAVRVHLADDHIVFREGLEAILASRQNVEVVGRSSTGQEAAALIRQTKPDLVITQLDMELKTAEHPGPTHARRVGECDCYAPGEQGLPRWSLVSPGLFRSALVVLVGDNEPTQNLCRGLDQGFGSWIFDLAHVLPRWSLRSPNMPLILIVR
jgi:DNA-binding NarL/FixJ family response regulator